jgi:hypothetical protein
MCIHALEGRRETEGSGIFQAFQPCHLYSCANLRIYLFILNEIRGEPQQYQEEKNSGGGGCLTLQSLAGSSICNFSWN